MLEAKHLERLGERVDEPEVLDPVSRVERYLEHAVEARRRWRERLTDPVGGEVDEGSGGNLGQAGLGSRDARESRSARHEGEAS